MKTVVIDSPHPEGGYVYVMNESDIAIALVREIHKRAAKDRGDHYLDIMTGCCEFCGKQMLGGGFL